ncbi:hypothetical protein [Halopiger thermotolerans]
MDAPESRDPITGVRLERPEPPMYMPGTPTASFLEFLELAVAALRR